MPDDALTPEEQAAMSALPREATVPAGLENRVIDGLRRGGLLRQSRWPRLLGYAAAAMGLFAAGLGAGSFIGASPSTARPRYLLLLYGAPDQSHSETQARIAEYRAWARAERSAGHLLEAEQLGPDTAVLGAARASFAEDADPSGFFLIAATSMADARAIAARCPHLRHGGTVVVRAIEDTR